MKTREQLRLLLLQIRESESVKQEELQSFASYAGLSVKQFDVLNVFDTPDFPDTVADGYDALIVGGASDANVLLPDTYCFVPACQQLLARCADTGLPVFASCFGFQLAVLALGGEILHKETDFEMGTLPIGVSCAGKDDPLFRDTPDGFYAVSVHKQYASHLPEGCIELAATEQCMHAFRYQSQPFWAFQFHPEVDKKILVERLTFYKRKYTEGDGQLDRVLANAVETPESNGLVRKFVDRVLLGE